MRAKSVVSDSLGEDTGVGCHFRLQERFPTQQWNPRLICLLHWQVDSSPLAQLGSPKWKWKSLSRVRLFATPWTYSPWNSPGQNSGVGSLSLLQGILPTQGSRTAGGFFPSWAIVASLVAQRIGVWGAQMSQACVVGLSRPTVCT